jgi:hypothetical protein
MILRPLKRIGCLRAILFCIGLFIVYRLLSEQTHQPLDKRLASTSIVHASALADDWDTLCVATPYCYRVDGAPDAMEDVCHEMGSDDDFGLAFFRGGRTVFVERVHFADEIRSARSCFNRNDDPVISRRGGDIVVKPAKDAP